jgi:hypothetical protein
MAKKVIKINTNPVPKVTIKTLLQQTGQNTLGTHVKALVHMVSQLLIIIKK